MNSFTIKSFATLFLMTLCAAPCSIKADTVYMKDGSQVKGQIIEEGPNGVTIEYFATATIKDQKNVAKADIDRIDKTTPDQKDFEELGNLNTPATVMDSSFYDPLVDRKLPEFISKYPDSTHNAEVNERLKTLTEERNRVNQGDRRVDSVWITASEIASNPYQTGALIKYNSMKVCIATNNTVEALRDYELLEKNYPGSAVMSDAVVTALKQLDLLQSQILIARTNGEMELKNISNAVSTSRADEAKMLKDGVDMDINNAKAAMKAAGIDGSKFFPIYQKSKEALDALQSLITAERLRLSQFQVASMRDGIAAAKEGLRFLKEEKLKEAKDQLAVSQKLWPANIDNTKLKDQLDQLNAALASKAASAAKEAAEKAARTASKDAVEKAAKQKADAEAAKEAAEKAAKVAAEKEAAEKAAATPTPTQDITGKLKDRGEILDVLGK